MDSNDLVLCVVRQAGTVPGRTALQKLCYFANEKIDAGVSFKAHYYGPFSRSVAMSTDLLVISNFLSEARATGTLSHPSVDSSGDVKTEWEQHNYQITLDGEKYFQNKVSKFGDTIGALGSVIEGLRRLTGLDASQLSEMAKIHYLEKHSAARSVDDLVRGAAGFGWQLSNAAVEKALSRLEELSL